MIDKNIMILIVTAILVSSCVLSPGQKYKEDESSPKIEEVQDLFIKQDDDTIMFRTNDPKYISPKGYTLWGLSDEPATNFTSRTLSLTKLSGTAVRAGYGGIYCYTNDPDYGQTFITVMINRNKQYCVGEVINNFQFNYLVEWTSTDFLYNGFGQENKVTLTYDSMENLFHLYINGNKMNSSSFRDDEEPIHLFGKQGYVVTISPLDKFPEEPVQVLIKEDDGMQ